MSKNKQALFTSNNQIYETPDYLFKELSDVFRFKLDVCASHENAKCILQKKKMVYLKNGYQLIG